MINITETSPYTHLHFTSTNYIFKRLFIFKRTSDQALSSSSPQKKEQQTQQKSSLLTWQISKTNTRSAPVILSSFLEHSSFGETTLQNFSLISCTSPEAQYSTSVKCTPILTGTCMFSQSSCPSQHQKSCPILTHTCSCLGNKTEKLTALTNKIQANDNAAFLVPDKFRNMH